MLLVRENEISLRIWFWRFCAVAHLRGDFACQIFDMAGFLRCRMNQPLPNLVKFAGSLKQNYTVSYIDENPGLSVSVSFISSKVLLSPRNRDIGHP